MSPLLRIVSLSLFLGLGLLWASGAEHVRRLSPYVYEEPHVMAPVWEAVARGEWFVRCSSNYAIGVSTCSSYGALLDSLPIRIAAAALGAQPPLSQPEWVQPRLQWLLALKHGITTVLLLALSFFLLAPAVGYFYSLVPFVLLAGYAPFAEHSFFVRPDGEMAAAILFLFCLAWRQVVFPPIRAFWPGLLAGVLAPIKLPVLPFAILALRGWKPRLAFLFVAGFFFFGLTQSSYELSSFFRNAYQSASLGVAKGYQHPGLGAAESVWWHNLKIFTANQPWLFLFVLLGWAFTLKQAIHNHSRQNWVVFALLFFLFLLPLKTQNGQERFLMGFTAISFVCAAYGISRLAPRFGWALLVICAGIFLNTRVWKQSNFSMAAPELVVSTPEKFLLDLAKSERDPIYVEERLLFQLDAAPLNEQRTRFIGVDLLEGSFALPPGRVLITLCYATDTPSEFGIESFGAIGKAIREQCPKALHTDYLNRPHLRFRPGHEFSNLVSVRTDKNSKKPFAVSPLPIAEKPVLLLPQYFRASGGWMKTYEAPVTSQASRQGGGLQELRKFLRFNSAGSFRVIPEVESKYRSNESRLFVLIDNVETSSCSLGSASELPYPALLPGPLRPWYATWRSLFLPKPCELSFVLNKKGLHELKLRVESQEKFGQARFIALRLEKIK